jgi:agmatine deiminase
MEKKMKYRRPAEFEKHNATWLCWPHAKIDWLGKMSAINWDYAEIVRHLSSSEPVHIIVQSEQHKEKVKSILNRIEIDLTNIDFFIIKTNRSWLRDNGPIYIKNILKNNLEQKYICNFGFNGWARFPTWKLDNNVPEIISEKTDMPVINAVFPNGEPMILEGGSIDVNGQGTLITTEQCLLSKKKYIRNPGKSRREIEQVIKKYLGITNIIWLNEGLFGDDTHGHIDNVCRFVSHDTVLVAKPTNRKDPNYEIMEENIRILESSRLENGEALKIIVLPMPGPLSFKKMKLTASYTNFYISNKTVLVPTFNDPADRIALNILHDCFPSRTVVGINSVNLIVGGGSIHCLTQEEIYH